MSSENVRDDLETVRGVARSETAVKPGETRVSQAWRNEALNGPHVGELVDALLGTKVPEVRAAIDEVPRKRTGLGRGLVDLLPEDNAHPVPMQLQPEAASRRAVSKVSVVESVSGVSVTVSDNKDREATVTVGDDGSIDSAVISAVVELFGIVGIVGVSVDELDVASGTMLVASASNGPVRSAGAAFVEFGRPSAVARAVFQAIAGMP